MVTEFQGQDELKAVQLKNVKTSQTTTLSVSGVFIAIGMVPNTAWLKDLVTLDEWGFIRTNEIMATNIPGIFAAGDVRSKLERQISTAVGDGTIATIAVERYLETIK